MEEEHCDSSETGADDTNGTKSEQEDKSHEASDDQHLKAFNAFKASLENVTKTAQSKTIKMMGNL